MNNRQFFNSFTFNKPRFYKYHFTDNSVNGSPTNYIGVMLSGTAKIKMKAHILNLKSGDTFFIPKNLPYQSFWYGDESEWVSWLSFGFDYFPDKSPHIFSTQKIDCSVNDLSMLLSFQNDFTVNCTNVGILYSFLGKILNAMTPEPYSFNPIGEAALEFMKNTTNYRIKDIADHCGISESGLYAIFKKQYEKTPVQMRQQILCEKASELLMNTNFTVEEISSQLNFSSSSYFRKVMKKHLGKTPLTIRKEAHF